MGSSRPKQFLGLEGKPLLALTLEAFQRCPAVDSITVVVPSDEIDYCTDEIVKKYGIHKAAKVIPGGARRQDSVRLGIEASDEAHDLVLIHDAVRPFVDQVFLAWFVELGKKYRAVVTGRPAYETVKEVNQNGEIENTYPRERVWLVQTPQIFRRADILAAHRKAFEESWQEATDDAMLVEQLGIKVRIVRGIENNIKITTPLDMDFARLIMRRMHG
jgi:2-C-methyl-D-erythritol 4-phosphate cytidylyltransferase